MCYLASAPGYQPAPTWVLIEYQALPLGPAVDRATAEMNTKAATAGTT